MNDLLYVAAPLALFAAWILATRIGCILAALFLAWIVSPWTSAGEPLYAAIACVLGIASAPYVLWGRGLLLFPQLQIAWILLSIFGFFGHPQVAPLVQLNPVPLGPLY